MTTTTPAPSEADAAASAPPAHTRFEDFVATVSDLWNQRLASFGAEQMIKVEQFTDDGSTVIRAELPGIDPENDVEVTLDRGRVRIAARRERREEHSTDTETRSEFHYGSFTRTIPVPAGAVADDISAEYTDGILEVRIPLPEEPPGSQTIPINRKD